MTAFAVGKVRRAAQKVRELETVTFDRIARELKCEVADLRSFIMGVVHLREELRVFMPQEEFRLPPVSRGRWKKPARPETHSAPPSPASLPSVESSTIAPDTPKMTTRALYVQAAARIRAQGKRVTRPRLAEELGKSHSTVSGWLSDRPDMIATLGIVRAKKHEEVRQSVPVVSRRSEKLERMKLRAAQLREEAFRNTRSSDPTLVPEISPERYRLSNRRRKAMLLRALILKTNATPELCG